MADIVDRNLFLAFLAQNPNATLNAGQLSPLVRDILEMLSIILIRFDFQLHMSQKALEDRIKALRVDAWITIVSLNVENEARKAFSEPEARKKPSKSREYRH